MKKQLRNETQDSNNDWHKKPAFGSLYLTKGSKYIYISMNYFKERLRFPSDKVDSPENWQELCEFLAAVGDKIRRRTFNFGKTFYWLDESTKAHFAVLEGRDFKPEPEHVFFGEYAKDWAEKVIPTFSSPTKKRDYLQAINSRILPYFGKMTFAQITATEVQKFIDNLSRCDRTKEQVKSGKPDKALSVKRVKNITGPLTKIWMAACNHYNFNLRDPFSGIGDKYTQLTDQALQNQEKHSTLQFLNGAEDDVSKREVFLLEEWQRFLSFIDPHYHVVMDLLMNGMIGSELEGLMKQHVSGQSIEVRCSVVKIKSGEKYLKFKPKNWYRKREIPITSRLKGLLDRACTVSCNPEQIIFANDITIPAHQFVLTMKDGSPFNYNSFVKTEWIKALKKAGLPLRVPYSSRHTFVQWALLLGVSKNRLVDLMGHSTKKMIDEVYGKYRQGLIDDREKILNFLGEDFLALEELRVTFQERYRSRMLMLDQTPETAKAPALAATFGQSFGQSQGL